MKASKNKFKNILKNYKELNFISYFKFIVFASNICEELMRSVLKQKKNKKFFGNICNGFLEFALSFM